MAQDRMQQQRFEQKYMLDADCALKVREFVSSYLELDENGVGKPDCAYPVHSLYLDSDQLHTYWATVNGDKNRFKLRLRFYSDRAESPVFFEIKRRVNNCILKQRGGVRRADVDWLLSGQLPQPDHLLSKDPRQLVALQRFCALMERLQARPKVHIAYQREAWVHPTNNSVRVTLDRRVCAEAEPEARFSTAMRRPHHLFGSEVILELKFTDRFPDWFGELVRKFNLTQCGAAKYCEGVDAIGRERLGAHAPPPTLEFADQYQSLFDKITPILDSK